ncbi:MAG: L,D-transpeptidase family protein [Nitrosomonas sp.]|nr:L,D-transpeptidase family protein [Nitrosomonas sp.]
MRYFQFEHYFWLLRFACCLLLLSNPCTLKAFAIDSKMLQQKLNVEKGNTDSTTKNALVELQRFYKARNYEPVWFLQTSSSSLLDTALTFIESADKEGLDSRDYQFSKLLQLKQLEEQRSSSQSVTLELQTTRAVLTLARDLSRGRLSASSADPDWHIPQPSFDAVAFLQKALQSEDLTQSFNSLSPQEPSYQLLKQTLIRYQQISNNANWEKIPDMPSLRPHSTDSAVVLLRQRIAQAYAIEGIEAYNITPSDSLVYDEELVNAIKAFQIQHNLNADGVIGRNTLKALNTPLEWRIRQLRISMERLRWLPKNLGNRHILVNIAGFRLTAAEQGKSPLNMRIIVGMGYRSTPSFKSNMSHMVLNPYWTVPATIAQKDLLPKQQKNPAFFTTSNFKVYASYDREAEPIDPASVDWRALKNFPFLLRQQPGKNNALGRVKFMFPNSFDIYLHDTPSRALFQKDVRTFSSGCIRLEKPFELAAFVLGKQELSETFLTKIEEGNPATMHVPKQLPIYLVYITAWVDEQQNVHFSSDIYDRDMRALRYAGW